MTTNSWGIPPRRQAPRFPWVRDRWADKFGWVECKVIERNGSLRYVEDTDTGERGWVGEEELR
jgi:hypothetical protein